MIAQEPRMHRVDGKPRRDGLSRRRKEALVSCRFSRILNVPVPASSECRVENRENK